MGRTTSYDMNETRRNRTTKTTKNDDVDDKKKHLFIAEKLLKEQKRKRRRNVATVNLTECYEKCISISKCEHPTGDTEKEDGVDTV